MLTRVADGVLVHQSPLLRNNTVVVEGSAGVLVVDAGITGAEMTCLAHDLRGLGLPVVAGFSTHPDWDHVLWHPDLGDAPRYGTASCADRMRALRASADWRARVTEGLPEEIAEDIPLDPFGLVTALPDGTDRIPWDGPVVRVVEHPAHSPGHAALLVEDLGVLVAGDMLSDVFVPMLDEFTPTNDPVEEYLVGLRLLEVEAGDVDVVIPGHGSVGGSGEARARIELDRAYVHALRDGRTPDDPRIGPRPNPGGSGSATSTPGRCRASRGGANSATHPGPPDPSAHHETERASRHARTALCHSDFRGHRFLRPTTGTTGRTLSPSTGTPPPGRCTHTRERGPRCLRRAPGGSSRGRHRSSRELSWWSQPVRQPCPGGVVRRSRSRPCSWPLPASPARRPQPPPRPHDRRSR